jgi:hypothetical protein
MRRVCLAPIVKKCAPERDARLGSARLQQGCAYQMHPYEMPCLRDIRLRRCLGGRQSDVKAAENGIPGAAQLLNTYGLAAELPPCDLVIAPGKAKR